MTAPPPRGLAGLTVVMTSPPACLPSWPSCPDPASHGTLNGEPVGERLPAAWPCEVCGAGVYIGQIGIFGPGTEVRDGHPVHYRLVTGVLEQVHDPALALAVWAETRRAVAYALEEHLRAPKAHRVVAR